MKDEAGLKAEWNETFKLSFIEDDSTDIQLFSYDEDMMSSDLIGKTQVFKLNKYPEGYTTEVLK